MDFKEIYKNMDPPQIEYESLDSGFDSLPSVSQERKNSFDNDKISTVHNTRVSVSPFNDHLQCSSKTSSTRSSPINSQLNSPRMRRKHRMHEGIALPLEELRMAAMHDNLPLVRALVKQGIAVDQILKGGWTTLMYACSSGNPQIVGFLLQEGADPNMHKELFTALMAACASSHNSESRLLECVKHLIDYGANVNIAERHRVSALMFASKEGRLSIVQCLVENKATINVQDNKGWSALSWAAAKGHGRVVRYLLEQQANPTSLNTFGQRPSDLALAAGYSEISLLLDQVTNMEGKCLSPDIMEKNSTIISQIPDVETPKLAVEEKEVYGELDMVLTGIDLKNLIPLFDKHQISMEGFLRLTEADLEKMGIAALGARKKIITTIREIHQQDWKTSSLPNLSQVEHITLPQASSMMANINRHLQYIRASVGYLRDQIQATPRILQLGVEKHTVSTLSEICTDANKNVTFLGLEIKFFNNHLRSVEQSPEFGQADLIVNKNPPKSWQRTIMQTLVSSTCVATVIYFVRPHIFAALFCLKAKPTIVTLDM